MNPLKGHTDNVTSVGFYGTHIMSGSLDKTVRIWDVRTGEEVMKSSKEHPAAVTSAAFSPDGTHIVSGSRDNTIRKPDTMWVPSGEKAADGTHIVSGSRDNTIRKPDTM